MDKQIGEHIALMASSLMIQEQVSLYVHGEPNEAIFLLIQNLFEKKQLQQLYVGESRPAFWSKQILDELEEKRIPATLICDSAAAHLYKYAPIDWLVFGAEKIAANGDAINTIGSYQLAFMAKQQQIKTLILAASASIDRSLESAENADIDQGEIQDLLQFQEQLKHCSVANPVQDITPANLIDAIVTEKGLILSPNEDAMSVQFA